MTRAKTLKTQADYLLGKRKRSKLFFFDRAFFLESKKRSKLERAQRETGES